MRNGSATRRVVWLLVLGWLLLGVALVSIPILFGGIVSGSISIELPVVFGLGGALVLAPVIASVALGIATLVRARAVGAPVATVFAVLLVVVSGLALLVTGFVAVVVVAAVF